VPASRGRPCSRSPIGDSGVGSASTNSDASGSVQLRGLQGEFEALGAVSLKGESSSFTPPSETLIGFGDGVEAARSFSCQSPGFGSYGVNVSSESVVEVEGRETVTALTVAIDAVVVCAE